MEADARRTWRDFLVIGAGPAGLQLGYFFEKSGLDYAVLEGSDEIASFFATYPRSRQLISFNKTASIYDDPEVRLRWDWNSLLCDYELPFSEYSKRLYPTADELRRYLADFAARYAIKIRYRTRVERVCKREDGTFELITAGGERYGCRCLIVATGFGKPFIPDIPGIDLVAEGYENVSLDPDDFYGQRVLIIGKGNSAFEIADNILGAAALVHVASPTAIRLAWKTRHPGNVRAGLTQIIDTYQLKLLNGALDCDINMIERRGGAYVVTVSYVHADGEVEQLVYDRVIRCTGFQFDSSIFDTSCRPALVIEGKLPHMKPSWESTNVPDLYFAGTLMQARDFRKASSAFIDGYRYNIRTLSRLLEARYCGRPLPFAQLEATGRAITEATLARICRTSGLWAQFGHLCDVIAIDPASGLASYYEELPVDYVHQVLLRSHPHYYTVTFEWGSWNGDPLCIPRHPKHEAAYSNVFLHPIVRRFKHAAMIEAHHVLEDLLGMYCHTGETGTVVSRSWRDMTQYHQEEHYAPLRAFFDEQLRGVAAPPPARESPAGM